MSKTACTAWFVFAVERIEENKDIDNVNRIGIVKLIFCNCIGFSEWLFAKDLPAEKKINPVVSKRNETRNERNAHLGDLRERRKICPPRRKEIF